MQLGANAAEQGNAAGLEARSREESEDAFARRARLSWTKLIRRVYEVLNWTRLSCQHFVSNQVRLALFVLAYNLGNFLRRLVLPRRIKH